MKKRSKLQDGIFLAAGIYLVYIAYQLFRELPESTGARVGLIIAAVVFAVVGVWVAIRSVRAFLPGNQQDESADEGENETAEVDEAQTAEEVENQAEAKIPDSTDQPEDLESEKPEKSDEAEEPEEESQEAEEEPEELEEEPVREGNKSPDEE